MGVAGRLEELFTTEDTEVTEEGGASGDVATLSKMFCDCLDRDLAELLALFVER
jgi:hypothetical protein